MTKTTKTITVFIAFAIAMAFLESTVVVYLRALYYPGGFAFPLQIMDPTIAFTEIFREAATMIMLVTVAILTGKTKMERFSFFVMGFAVWDIFYYIFLKIILGWPESLLTWDILFLIPWPWVGPVVAPVINSLTMIVLASFIIHFSHHGRKVSLNGYEWTLLIVGSLVVLSAYTEEYIRFMTGEFRFSEIFLASKQVEIMHYASGFIPHRFNWYLFSAGAVLDAAAIILYVKRVRKRV
jgi:hypothetical protein